MPRPPRFDTNRPPRNKKEFRRGDTPRTWKGRGPQEGREEAAGPEERLQKVLAAMGVGSRRDCEELIKDGRVEVDKQVVTVLGTKVDPFKHEIRVDGEMLKRPERMYFAVNKPEGVVTTNFDPSGRERVIDLVPTDARLFAVGRLDRSSEGLIILTNDGEFANRLTHPRYGVEKSYLVRVAGEPAEEKLNKLRRGVHLAEGVCRVERIVIKGRHKKSTDMIIVLKEGRNREIRRILARVGHKVLKLRRVGIGRLRLGDLPIGAWRKLAAQEVAGLMHESRQRKVGRGERGEGRKKPWAGGQETLPRSASEGDETAIPVAREGISEVPAAMPPLPRHDVMPELSGGDDDGDLDVDDFANVGDVEMLEISGFGEDESPAAQPPGEVLDYGGEAESSERPPPRGRFEKRTFARGQQHSGRSGEASGERPFKKKRFERGSSRDVKAGGKPERKYGPRPEGASSESGGEGRSRNRGAKFGGGPGKKFGGKPGGRPAGGKPGRGKGARPAAGKPDGRPAAGKFGGKKRFKPKGKGRP